ncbi:response regulator transcription factor [Streptomyces phyllanthi]|uniref:Response regulator transcription factor n=1 Tax=Streptomyces phyllanthi TaxID=1803180 RepID=A0A5N8W279_9ACTN|nr:response regulator transcription factor [Streptomyces phyllanthi]MPY40275.1 response regulator transcription factor [Streptomyces phyllanthi]
MTRILVVDDDPRIRSLVHRQLSEAGYEVTEATDGRAALERMADEAPALVVLDLSLPGVGGLDVLRAVRTGRAGAAEDLPVIILSGRGGETDRIVGLDLGADDYLVKPFSPAELAARVRSVLRRAGPDPAGCIVNGPLRIEPATHEVWVEGSRVELTAKEFDLIVFFASHPRQVFTRHQLLQHIWKSAEWLGEATVTEHVHRVRGKLQAAGGPRMIRTIRGVGYSLDVPV